MGDEKLGGSDQFFTAEKDEGDVVYIVGLGEQEFRFFVEVLGST